MGSVDEIALLNTNIVEVNNKNKELIKKIVTLQNYNSGASGEYQQKSYLYNQLLTENIVILCMILGIAGLYIYKRKTKK